MLKQKLLSQYNLLRPNPPQNLEASNITPTSVDLNWDASPGAQSYVVQQSPIGLSQPLALGQIRYVEINFVHLDDTRFAGTTRGFSILAFPIKFTGATEQDKINAAMASGLGSERSNVVTIEFPAATNKKKKVK